MIVNHLNTVVHGGAAMAARRLHEALCSIGVESHFWSQRLDAHTAHDPTYHRLTWNAPAGPLKTAWRRVLGSLARRWHKRQLKRALAGRPEGLELFSTARLPIHTPLPAELLGSGILHLHWVANLLDYPSFFASIPADTPIVWTLHDMFPFTGGCHYAGRCDVFLTECKNCPQLGQPGDKDLANVSFHAKRRALRGKNLHIVAPSQWMARQAKRSRLLANARSIQVINYPVDTELFQPHDKLAARKAWNLPADRTVLAFGADYVANRRKGFRELLDALSQLTDKRRVLVVVLGRAEGLPGLEPRDTVAASERVEMRPVGFVDDPHRQALLYSAADLVVVPSLEDNSPQVGLEALACGTPVVAFAAGGLPDYVRPQQTGLLAQVGSSQDLARQINWLIQHPQDGRRMGHNGRSLVEREYSAAIQAGKYRDLYQRLLADAAAVPPELVDHRAAA